jgi:hypothetical protein
VIRNPIQHVIYRKSPYEFRTLGVGFQAGESVNRCGKAASKSIECGMRRSALNARAPPGELHHKIAVPDHNRPPPKPSTPRSTSLSLLQGTKITLVLKGGLMMLFLDHLQNRATILTPQVLLHGSVLHVDAQIPRKHDIRIASFKPKTVEVLVHVSNLRPVYGPHRSFHCIPRHLLEHAFHIVHLPKSVAPLVERDVRPSTTDELTWRQLNKCLREIAW